MMLLGLQANAQDTTWVQTFTFDSISTRRADFQFPASLDTMRFEKVLMYYKLKCSPLTPWDQYDCGEWDYLAYTRIFDHTGMMDSVQVDSMQYVNNFQSTGTYNYAPYPMTLTDEFVRTESYRTGATLTSNNVLGAGAADAGFPFNIQQNGGRFQMLVTQAELAAAGIGAGDIQSLSLFVPTGGVSVNGELWHPLISMKSTTDTDLTGFHDANSFTEVYNRSRVSPLGASEMVDGENEMLFYQPFTWNGTDNIVIEFFFDQDYLPANALLFEQENTTGNMAFAHDGRNGAMYFDGTNHALIELSDYDFGDDITISFWSKGDGNNGVNTSILEAKDTLNNRVFNIHFPWSNNQVYWDCGEGNGYDRINTGMTAGEIDNEWHHWAFVKNVAAGELKIFKDGVLFHSGTGFTRSVGDMHRLILGGNRSLGNHWTGWIDEFQIFDVAVDDATIGTWYNQDATGHPNSADLLYYTKFNDEKVAIDETSNGYLLMPSAKGMIDFTGADHNVDGTVVNRPRINLGTGTVAGAVTTQNMPEFKQQEPEVVFELQQVNHHFAIVDAFLAHPEGITGVYDESGGLVSSTPITTTQTLSNQTVTYYEEPYEIINDVEIGRFITPYGIQFDLGPNGFSWIYDVTDYQMYLKDVVDLAAHNTQELIDLKFAFIEGIPPRDVHARQPIWSDWRSYSYGSMDDDTQLQSTDVVLSDTSSMFKIKTRFTGHGHHGSVNCCEWDSKDHMISVDGVERFNWEIWEETACGDNPNVSQGGTWPYAREGWCPGDLVKEYDHDLTPFVVPGATVALDYDIEDVPVNDAAQASGNYVVAMDLISYGEPNFQHDAAIIDILNPNSYEYYQKWNPTCQNPRVIIQNTGAQPLTACNIRIWISYGDFIEYEWTGNLEFLEKEVVEIPVADIGWWNDYHGEGYFNAQIWNVGNVNPALDEYPNNDFKKVKFEAPEMISGPFEVWFTTNNKANENNWRLEDADGNVVFERTTLTNNTSYRDTFDLEMGCYSLVIEDSDSDGLGYWYSNQVEGETNGQFRVKLIGGPIVEYFPTDFGNFHRYNFSVGFTVNLDEEELDHEIKVFPNPNDGVFEVELLGSIGNKAEIQIYDLMGRQVFSEKMNANGDFASSSLELQHIPAGHYMIKIVTSERVYTKEFVKN